MASIQDIQFLRQETGAGIMDCKNTLGQANGNLQQFIIQAIVGLDVKINVTEFFRYEKSEDL